MIVSKNIPILPYIFLAIVILIKALKFQTLLYTFNDDIFVKDESVSHFNFETTFLINSSNFSNNLKSEINVLVLITSMASELKLREQIRNSWANQSEYEEQEVRVEFLLGRPDSNQLKQLQIEHQTHNDLIVADILEGYYELSSKTISMLEYKKRFHPNVKCLIKADIDNILILRNFARLCEETVAPSILGKCDVSRTVRRTSTKWAVPEFVWPYPLFPQYCSSGTYILVGRDLPEILLNEAKYGTFSRSANIRKMSEDVLVTGILAESANIRRRHLAGFSFFAIPEFFCRNSFKNMYSIHMTRDKNPVKYFRKVRKWEATRCSWWDVYGIKNRY